MYDTVVLLRSILNHMIFKSLPSLSSNHNNLRYYSTKTIRDIIVDHAQIGISTATRTLSSSPSPTTNDGSVSSPNQMAIKLLQWDKEINLLRYSGFVEYSKQKIHKGSILPTRIQRWLSSSSSTKTFTNKAPTTGMSDATDTVTLSSSSVSVSNSSSAIQTQTSSSSISGSRNVAKVAFMITASMRNELINRLGYSVDEIRLMKPNEASIILQHSILSSSTDRDSKIQELLLLHQQEQEEMQRQEQQQQMNVVDSSSSSISSIESSSSTSVAAKQAPTFFSSSRSTSSSLSTSLSSKKTQWFEIVEYTTIGDVNDENSKYEVVGLYKTLVEAELGLETLAEFSERKREQHKLKVSNQFKQLSSASSTTGGNENIELPMTYYKIRESWR